MIKRVERTEKKAQWTAAEREEILSDLKSLKQAYVGSTMIDGFPRVRK